MLKKGENICVVAEWTLAGLKYGSHNISITSKLRWIDIITTNVFKKLLQQG